MSVPLWEGFFIFQAVRHRRTGRPNEQLTMRNAGDPTRPVYHFVAPAGWLQDANGPIFREGYYHLFYQLNPYGDRHHVPEERVHWGHARSSDPVHWEHLPIALWPSEEQGEKQCFSGCAVINDLGQPMAFYTSISAEGDPQHLAEQWAAVSDEDLIVWQKHPANPLLSQQLHGDLRIYDWRAPFVLKEKGRTYMVIGGNLKPFPRQWKGYWQLSKTPQPGDGGRAVRA